MSTQATTVTSTWGGNKYATAYRKPGHYKGVLISFEKSQVNNIDWFLKLSIDGKDSNKVQVQNRWQNDTNKSAEQQTKTLNALAMMLVNAMDSLGITYDQSDIEGKTFEQLVALTTTKGLIGKQVNYEIRERQGESAKLQQIIFE